MTPSQAIPGADSTASSVAPAPLALRSVVIPARDSLILPVGTHFSPQSLARVAGCLRGVLA